MTEDKPGPGKFEGRRCPTAERYWRLVATQLTRG